MRVAVGALVLDVPFDSAGPYMPTMGIALGPVDELESVALGKTALQKAKPLTYRRTLTTMLTFVEPGMSEVDAVIGEVKRLSAATRAPIATQEQMTVANRPAALVDIIHTEGGIPVLTQAAIFVANGVLHTVALAALNGPKAADVRKQFRGLLTKVSAFGDR